MTIQSFLDDSDINHSTIVSLFFSLLIMILDESYFTAFFQCFHGLPESYLEFISRPHVGVQAITNFQINSDCIAVSINDCILSCCSLKKNTYQEGICKLNSLLAEQTTVICIDDSLLQNPSSRSFHGLVIVFDLVFCTLMIPYTQIYLYRRIGEYDKALSLIGQFSEYTDIPDEFQVCLVILKVYILFDLHFMNNISSDVLLSLLLNSSGSRLEQLLLFNT